jgi:regulator of sigma E protease
VVVLAHEWGHFMAARRAGVFVEEFAIGMGPRLVTWGKPKRKKNDDGTAGGEPETTGDYTVYSIRAFPIGGFCKMYGEEETQNDPRSLSSKKVSSRMLIMAAGALMNFALAFVLLFVYALLVGHSTTTVLRSSMENSPAMAAGILPGDRITHLNGSPVLLLEDMKMSLQSNGDKPVTVRFVRGGEVHETLIAPTTNEYGEYMIGIQTEARAGLLSNEEGVRRVNLFSCIADSFKNIIFFLKFTLAFVVQLFTGRADISGMAGMIGVGGMVNDVYVYQTQVVKSVASTVLTMVNLCALLSANLGIINLLPLPALDGGKIVFLTIEGIRRKPISPEREGMVHFVGFVLLMILAVFIAYQDIMRLI